MYLANNKLSSTREINNITQLTKLIILDLSGNPLSKDPNYRVYTLYNLKKLKVFIHYFYYIIKGFRWIIH